MGRLRAVAWSVAVVAILAMGATVAVAAPSAPYETNGECLECHDASTGAGAVSRVEFDVPAAMQARCKSCHSQQYHWSHYQGNTCGGCHPGRPEVYALYGMPQFSGAAGTFQSSGSLSASPQTLHSIHANGSIWQYDQDDIDGTQCNKCHGPAACSSCHGSDPNAATHTAHTGADSAYPAVTYTQSTGTMAVTAPVTCVNAACHSLSKAGLANFVPTCSSCHATRVNEHGYDAGQHTADVTMTVDGGGKTCGDCHQMAVYAEHTRASSSSAANGCSTCHPTPRSTFGAWNQTCSQGGCHAIGSSAQQHAGQAADHAPLTTGDAAICGDCHAGALDVVHEGARSSVDSSKTSCLVCHSSTSMPATKDCTSCHFTYADHPYTPAAHLSDSVMSNCGGAGCHSSSKDLLTAHREKNPAFSCSNCHKSTDPVVVAAIANGLTTCSSCHSQISETAGHLAQHYANPLLIENGMPKYAYWTGSAAGGAYTSDCATCHTSNVIYEHMGAIDSLGNPITAPRKDRFGNPLTCDTCHLSLDVKVSGAIATGMTNCDACHVVHGPIDSTHQSSFVTDPQMNCTQCHSASLPIEHNGTFSTTTPSGRILVGCAVCHDYYEGARGQQVESAIAARDTKCTGCHTIHGTGDHTASGSADCVACHETGDAVVLHAGSPLGGCDVCHANPTRVPALPATTDCVNCHGGLSPASSNHYVAASHAANNGTEGTLACTQCHSLDMKTEHAGIVTCVQCHELKVDGFATAWDKSCTACHPTKHADISAAHAGVPPTNNTCTGSYCHPNNSTDLRAVHTEVGCAITGCHAAGNTPGVKACANCHAGYVDGHKSAGPIAEPYDSCTGTGCHTLATDIHGLATHPAKCASCHGLDAEMGCVCHDKTQIHSYTTHAAKACATCHPSGTSMPHGVITPKLTTSSTRAQWRAVCDDCHSSPHDRGTCTGCHSLSNLHGLDSRHTDGNSDCSKCHNVPAADLSDPCITCHPKGAPAAPTPGSGATPGVVAEPFGGCTNCHAVNAEVHRVASHPKECVDCHGVAQANACICHTETSVHAVSNHASADCTKCHESGVPKPHSPITNKLASGASNSTWKAACDDCHSRPHDRGTCSNCHSRSGLHAETSRHVDSNSDCKSCHGIQSADLTWNCLACHTSLGSSSGGSTGGGSWGGGGW